MGFASLFDWGEPLRQVEWVNEQAVVKVPAEKCIGCGIEINALAPTLSKLCNVCDCMVEAVGSRVWFVKCQNEWMAECEAARRLIHLGD